MLAILNEACIAPRASDADFVNQARDKLAGLPHFSAPKVHSVYLLYWCKNTTKVQILTLLFACLREKIPHTSFVIDHYAGQVLSLLA